jgi:hypothetical protein
VDWGRPLKGQVDQESNLQPAILEMVALCSAPYCFVLLFRPIVRRIQRFLTTCVLYGSNSIEASTVVFAFTSMR